MDKIDIHGKERGYERALENIKNSFSKHNSNLILAFLDAQALGQVTDNRSGVSARYKNAFLLKCICRFFKDKPLDRLTKTNVEDFVRALDANKIKKQGTGGVGNYSEQTKAQMKIVLMELIRWKYKDKVKVIDLTDWIDVKFKKKEIQALTEEDVYKMLDSCMTINQKFLICVLMDSGCRIDEFLNLRIGDLIEVKSDVPFYRMNIRNETSKTAGRTLGLFWKPSTDIIKAWLAQHPDKSNLDAQLYPSSYDVVRVLLGKISKKSLGRAVNAHLMRHTSATYYAGRGNDYFQLCKRYGWAIGSKTPQIYIDRSGIKEKEIEQKFKNENMSEMKDEMNKMKEKYKELLEKDNENTISSNQMKQAMRIIIQRLKLSKDKDVLEELPFIEGTE